MSGRQGEIVSAAPGGIERADLILLAIPLAFCAAYAAASLVARGYTLPVAGGSLAAGVLVVDGLFLNPPGEA
ncbi:hypothetical protein EXE46_07040 [Halorubrum sp. GN11_10-6_MGM]|uniref:hypothetical protein n=1 Tax=Halorubrum sp. GN11_10-6_MGM TaxID=2518112 RepID=UPI0010F8FB4C|nr:hypothetical protein [Halorubrum sp. GN11_10-6_MGM]TKX74784.1 hypothetical protein EXE46_07040 [Halorubrum sp. GN11_10-6_MGM]